MPWEIKCQVEVQLPMARNGWSPLVNQLALEEVGPSIWVHPYLLGEVHRCARLTCSGLNWVQPSLQGLRNGVCWHFPQSHRLQQNLKAPACALKPANAFFYSSLAASLEMRLLVPVAGSLPPFPHPVYPVWSPPQLVHTMALPRMKKLSKLCVSEPQPTVLAFCFVQACLELPL